MECKKPIRCWDNTVRGCKRDFNHEGHCNPFSNTYYPPTLFQNEEIREKKEVKKDETIQGVYERALKAAGLSVR